MSDLTVSLTEALQLRDRGALFIDARSPSEFAETTVPGAVNVPLFDDTERARVGTCYKEQGPTSARRLGVELAAPKIPRLVEQVAAVRGDRNCLVVVFCWRGGMRSKALTSFLDLAGVPARQMIGGHKAFRARVREYLAQGGWGRLLVLRGLTGVGKTRLLHRLAGEGYPVIDLEGLAAHRGSAFGGIGLETQPSQKLFEARLWDRLRHVPPEGYALVEGESRHIGRLQLPARVYQALQQETTLWLHASLDHRVRVILEDYPARAEHRQAFVRPIRALKERLGKARVAELLQLLENGAWEDLVRELMVHYYDPLYRHSLPERRIEIPLEPEEEGLERLRRAIGRVLCEREGGLCANS